MKAPTAPELLSDVRAALVDRDAQATIVDVETGREMLYVEVELDDGAREAGMVHGPDVELPDVTGQDALAVADRAASPSADLGLRAVGLGALNALSQPFMDWRTGDPMSPDPDAVDVIAMVGLFGPVLRSYDDLDVRILERDPDSVSLPDSLPSGVDATLHPPEAAPDVVVDADVLYVTGSTLLYGGIERYLDAAGPETVIVLVGATASFYPEPAFDAGVSVVAGAEVTDRTRVREVIAGSNCQDELHGNGLRKVYAQREGVDLRILALD
jgi:hypothetical protein